MYTKALAHKRRFMIGLLAGLFAGIIASALMLLLSTTVGSISLPEVFGSALTQVMPPSLFEYLHQRIGGDAKHYLFYCILVGQCLVFALSGGLWSWLVGLGRDRLLALGGGFAQMVRRDSEQDADFLHWTGAVYLALILWLLTGFVFLPLTGAGLFGAQLAIGPLNSMLSLGVIGVVFAFLFLLIHNWLLERQLHAHAPANTVVVATRRAALRRGLELLGMGAIGLLAWRFVTGGGSSTAAVDNSTNLLAQYKKKITPPPVPNYGTIETLPQLSPEITSNDQFYVVSKNIVADPTVDAAHWSLTVDGMVNTPYTLSYQELLALPTKPQYESLMCISNEVGGPYMSNALWDGIPLADLLQRAGGVKAGATKVVLFAVDDYSDSIHLSKALEPTTLLAVRMNGVTLPQGHGFPARLLVPGIYGMKHVKWLTRIQVVNTDYQGYWQQRGWSDAAPVRLTSRIDTPLADATLRAQQPTFIAGVAFSGDKGISEVDVSVDGGKSWQRATLKRPFSDLSWVLWELPWQPAAGVYTLVVRAVDLAGNVQDPSVESPLPDGSSGYHTVSVTVN